MEELKEEIKKWKKWNKKNLGEIDAADFEMAMYFKGKDAAFDNVINYLNGYIKAKEEISKKV